MPDKNTSQEFRFTAKESDRVDRLILAELQGVSNTLGRSVPTRSQIANWIAQGLVFIAQKMVTKAGAVVPLGAEVVVLLPEPRELSLQADPNVRLRVIHEEASFLVIDKPPGLVVHPGAGNQNSTLVHGLLHHLGEDIQPIGDAFRPGVVHRLDKDTSGLMVVAKTEEAFRNLAAQLKPSKEVHSGSLRKADVRRTMERGYLLLTAQIPRPGAASVVAGDAQSGTISFSIGRSTTQRTKMAAVAQGGRLAKTHWKVREAFDEVVLLEARLETGRTHQIRVHFQAAGAPLLGDPVYGKPRRVLRPEIERAIRELGRQALHAYSLAFLHPESGVRVEFTSPVPEDMQRLIEVVRKK